MLLLLLLLCQLLWPSVCHVLFADVSSTLCSRARACIYILSGHGQTRGVWRTGGRGGERVRGKQRGGREVDRRQLIKFCHGKNALLWTYDLPYST